MKLAEIEDRLERIDPSAGQDLIYELLLAYGTPQASITNLRTGRYDRSADPGTVLWKRKLWDHYAPDATEVQLLSLLNSAQADSDVRALKPRFYIARNDTRLAAVDSRNGQTLDVALTDLARHAAFFMPWAGAEQTRTETVSYVDTKVAQQMAKLYDEILATNPELPDSDDSRRNLNLFFSRLLFCFFAEDTGVFPDTIFTNAITTLTASDGSDTADFLDQLFEILDTPLDQRHGTASHFEGFGYVNGSLFTDRIHAPSFSRKARNIVIDCGTLDWNSINPDIFGSMIQAVTAGEDRASLGMHYTSVENILKVLNPLFLNDLEARYDDAADSSRKLQALLDHLGEIRVFDPACGSGNFLIVAYKRLRSLEHRILQRLAELDSSKAALFADSRISLDNFYGIEIDDFAHEIAKLSLWFAKHQMNQEYDDLFGIERPLIPLQEAGTVLCGNAVRSDWRLLLPPTHSTFVCGNPPYVGSRKQTTAHRADFAAYYEGQKHSKFLDYVSLWFLKAAEYIRSGSGAEAAFVSTNSVSQGQHAALLWPQILVGGIKIRFAHTSFLWRNDGVGSAGVMCVVIGLTTDPSKSRHLFGAGAARAVQNINPYLVASDDDTVVHGLRRPLSEVPPMENGSISRCGGGLVLTSDERNSLLADNDGASGFVRAFLGGAELLAGKPRYCLWIDDAQASEAEQVPTVERRLAAVSRWRRGSKHKKANSEANRPHRFVEVRHRESPYIALPVVSSERRDYIPVAYLDQDVIVSNKIYAIYGAEPWLLALLHSKIHMAWVEAICGRLKSDYSYSNTMGYNAFPFPVLTEVARSALSESALAILAARERWPDRSLAELYDPERMPANLRAAHEANDELVDSLYRSKPFRSDAERMELLLAMYRDLVAEADGASAGEG